MSRECPCIKLINELVYSLSIGLQRLATHEITERIKKGKRKMETITIMIYFTGAALLAFILLYIFCALNDLTDFISCTCMLFAALVATHFGLIYASSSINESLEKFNEYHEACVEYYAKTFEDVLPIKYSISKINNDIVIDDDNTEISFFDETGKRECIVYEEINMSETMENTYIETYTIKDPEGRFSDRVSIIIYLNQDDKDNVKYD